ncbi:hypothetical protein BJX64DRAFT_268226 [Aspergillus heterothallicus]
MARLSGLQKEVLSLYRKCLREIRKKPVESRGNFKSYTRYARAHNTYFCCARLTNSPQSGV